MNPVLEARLLATERYYLVAENHTYKCSECLDRLITDFLDRWEHMTGEKADRRGTPQDRAQRMGLTAAKAIEDHTDQCDFCLEISVRGFEERYAHAKSDGPEEAP